MASSPPRSTDSDAVATDEPGVADSANTTPGGTRHTLTPADAQAGGSQRRVPPPEGTEGGPGDTTAPTSAGANVAATPSAAELAQLAAMGLESGRQTTAPLTTATATATQGGHAGASGIDARGTMPAGLAATASPDWSHLQRLQYQHMMHPMMAGRQGVASGAGAAPDREGVPGPPNANSAPFPGHFGTSAQVRCAVGRGCGAAGPVGGTRVLSHSHMPRGQLAMAQKNQMLLQQQQQQQQQQQAAQGHSAQQSGATASSQGLGLPAGPRSSPPPPGQQANWYNAMQMTGGMPVLMGGASPYWDPMLAQMMHPQYLQYIRGFMGQPQFSAAAAGVGSGVGAAAPSLMTTASAPTSAPASVVSTAAPSTTAASVGAPASTPPHPSSGPGLATSVSAPAATAAMEPSASQGPAKRRRGLDGSAMSVAGGAGMGAGSVGLPGYSGMLGTPPFVIHGMRAGMGMLPWGGHHGSPPGAAGQSNGFAGAPQRGAFVVNSAGGAGRPALAGGGGSGGGGSGGGRRGGGGGPAAARVGRSSDDVRATRYRQRLGSEFGGLIVPVDARTVWCSLCRKTLSLGDEYGISNARVHFRRIHASRLDAAFRVGREPPAQAGSSPTAAATRTRNRNNPPFAGLPFDSVPPPFATTAPRRGRRPKPLEERAKAFAQRLEDKFGGQFEYLTPRAVLCRLCPKRLALSGDFRLSNLKVHNSHKHPNATQADVHAAIAALSQPPQTFPAPATRFEGAEAVAPAASPTIVAGGADGEADPSIEERGSRDDSNDAEAGKPGVVARAAKVVTAATGGTQPADGGKAGAKEKKAGAGDVVAAAAALLAGSSE